jgi:type I restriction enzyme S subunit
MAGLVVTDPDVDFRFVYHFLIHYRLSNLVSTTALPSLNNSVLAGVKIPLPPTRAEQQAIAKALADADSLVDSLEDVLAKKRALRRGLSDELLSGRRRLPGYSAKWNSTPLGELFEFKNGLNKAKSYFGSGSPIVNYMDVYVRPHVRVGDISGRVTLNAAERANYNVRRGDVLFTRTSETSGEIGLASSIHDELISTVFSGFLLRARPITDRLDIVFQGYALRSKAVRRQITSTASYTTRALTNGRLLSRVQLLVPPRDEQVAIATVLVHLDQELEALEAKLAAARHLKLGMSQVLLTGRVRMA